MPKINVLDKKTAELIAAGEVIERPSSVVKELVENSIDAGATVVTVEIRNGGVRLMRITDNGCGIDPEDIPKAFLRHATSKVRDEDDLYCISTLGFRGEALASVCAVSRVELLSRTPDAQLGHSYRVEGGEMLGPPVQAGGPQGTTIYVRDLFYNIPARMKFLKKDMTEGNAIATLLDRLALSHPEVSIRLIREGQQKLQTPGDGNLLSAIYAVYGKEFGETLIPVSGGLGAVKVSGYIVRPESAKSTRTMEHFFINERYVRSVTTMAAMEEAYRNSIMTGKFPGCVLHLRLPANSVDVNVHPAKLEVKLNDERGVFDAVYAACKDALLHMDQGVAAEHTASRSVKAKLTPFDLYNKPLGGEQQHLSAQQYRAATDNLPKKPTVTVTMGDNSAVAQYMSQLKKPTPPPATGNVPRPSEPRIIAPPSEETPILSIPRPTRFHQASVTAPLTAEPPQIAPAAPPIFIPEPAPEPEPEPMKLVGEAFATYIIAQQGEKLLLVDKHAAHERILFDKLKNEADGGEVGRQLLLASVRLSFAGELYDSLVNNLNILEQLGFLAEDFGNGSLMIREIPSILELSALEDTMLEIGEKLLKGNARPGIDRTDELLHSIACKAAVKGGYLTGNLERIKLLELLQNDSTLRSCPHGRPIIIELTRRELEKMFGRIV